MNLKQLSDKEPVYVYTKWDVWVNVDGESSVMHCKAYDILKSAIVPLAKASDVLFYFKGKEISAASRQNFLFEFETSDEASYIMLHMAGYGLLPSTCMCISSIRPFSISG